MRHAHRTLATTAVAVAVAVGIAGGAGAQAPVQKKVYCWDEGGRKVCSDSVPAEASNRARTEISMRSGLRTGQVARALTDDERMAARFAADLERRQAEAEAMRLRRDLAMVESYATEADLLRAYGARTELLDETVKASTLGVSNLRLSLLSLLRQAGDKELAGEPVPQPLAASIRTQHGELLHQQQILVVQRADRATLDVELADAVARYRALRKPEPATTPGSPDGAPAPQPAAPPTAKPAG